MGLGSPCRRNRNAARAKLLRWIRPKSKRSGKSWCWKWKRAGTLKKNFAQSSSGTSPLLSWSRVSCLLARLSSTQRIPRSKTNGAKAQRKKNIHTSGWDRYVILALDSFTKTLSMNMAKHLVVILHKCCCICILKSQVAHTDITINVLDVTRTAAFARRNNRYDGSEEFWVITKETGKRSEEMSYEERHEQTKKAWYNCLQLRCTISSWWTWFNEIVFPRSQAEKDPTFDLGREQFAGLKLLKQWADLPNGDPNEEQESKYGQVGTPSYDLPSRSNDGNETMYHT